MKVTRADRTMRFSVNRLKKQQTARLNQTQQTQQAQEQAYEEAVLRTVRTLNSIRAIFPPVLGILKHPRSSDRELQICSLDARGNESVMTLELAVSKRKRNKSHAEWAWLLGTYVYEVARKSQVESLETLMWQILECFLPRGSAAKWMDSAYNDYAWTMILAQIARDESSRCATPSPTSLVNCLPAEQVHLIAKSCDEQYLHVFHHKNKDAKYTRDLYQHAVDRLVANLTSVLVKRNRGAEVRVYGSCLSNLSLGKSSDVDISLHLPAAAELKRGFENGHLDAARYEREMKGCVYRINSLLSKASCRRLSDGRMCYAG